MSKLSFFILTAVLGTVLVLTGCAEQPANDSGADKSTTEQPTYDPDDYQWSTGMGPYNDKISYATSSNLTSWTDSGEVLVEHASVPGAVVKDGTIHVYFVDVATDGIPEQIGLIKSTDEGKTWSDKETIVIDDLGSKVAVDPAPFLLDDGRIRLYYYDINVDQSPSATFNIYSAVSADGLNFTEEAGSRFADVGTLDPDVIKVGDDWYMYTGTLDPPSVVVAKGTDGLNFTKVGTAFTDGAVPDVFVSGDDYYLYTAGINIAKSTNPENFSGSVGQFQSTIGQVTADPSVVELSDGTYLMLYKTSDGGGPVGPPNGDIPPPPPDSNVPAPTGTDTPPPPTTSTPPPPPVPDAVPM
ncbi:hypothetical protein ACFL0Z_01400 [Patescibacteria group bacterium]